MTDLNALTRLYQLCQQYEVKPPLGPFKSQVWAAVQLWWQPDMEWAYVVRTGLDCWCFGHNVEERTWGRTAVGYAYTFLRAPYSPRSLCQIQKTTPRLCETLQCLPPGQLDYDQWLDHEQWLDYDQWLDHEQWLDYDQWLDHEPQ